MGYKRRIGEILMKLCAIIVGGEPHVGVGTEEGIVDITMLGFPAYMNDVISGGEDMLSDISGALREKTHKLIGEEGVRFLPVTSPKKILCEGLNYKDHAEETGGKVPEHPIFFSKFEDSLTGSGEPVMLPPWLRCFDYEAELVIVVGKHAYNVSVEEAESCIFGYTCGNDLSARDSQFLSSQWLSGKALPGFAPVGPYIVTRDCFDPRERHGIFCEVNGIVVQSGVTSNMIFPCFEALSIASKFFPLSPGDLIFTGTPDGVIIGRPKGERVWLKSGDIVKVRIDNICELVTTLV